MTDILNQTLQNALPWLLDHGIRILVILVLALVLRRFGGVFIDKTVRRLVVSSRFLDEEAERKREDTLIRIFDTSLIVVIWTLAALMVLQEAGTDIAPLLATAGVAGIALGFGGQYLIRDLISGLFIILENQYRIGDVVCIDGTCGMVEDISMRMTTLRDLDGVVHHVPHGSVTKVSNFSKDFARVNLNVGVSYGADLEHVIAVVNKVGKDLAEDPNWKDSVLEPPQFVRVVDFADSAVMIKILGKTQPLKQWDVTGELRKRIKIAFDGAGIEIPFPQRVIHQG